MSVIQKFNNLQGKTILREKLVKIQEEALNDGPYHIYARISNALINNPKVKEFNISVSPCDDERDFCGLSYSPNYITKEEIGLGKGVSPNEIYEYITKIIIETIEVSGHLPWQRSWNKGMHIWDGVQAVNYDSKKPYRGINYWFTNFKTITKKGKHELVPRDLTNPYFLTFNQIKKHKGKLKKGSKAIRVFYFTKLYSHTEILPNGKKLSINTYDKKKFITWLKKNQNKIKGLKKNLYTIERLANSYIPILKYYNVYHGADVTGIKWTTFKKNKNPKLPKKDRIDIAENIVKAMPNVPDIIFKGNQPAYYPSFDHVRMTPIQAFNNEQSYYSTLFHELVHSTGHRSRLSRWGITGGKDKTKRDYAFEELIAEMGAVFLCAESGILFSVINNSASYLSGWNKKLVGKLKKDNRYFFRASSKAQAATDYILDRDKNSIPAYQKIKPKKQKAKSENKKTEQLQLALAGKQSTLTKSQQIINNKEVIAKSLGLDYNTVFDTNGRLKSGFMYVESGKVKQVKKNSLSRKQKKKVASKKQSKKKGLSQPENKSEISTESKEICSLKSSTRFSVHDIMSMEFKQPILPPEWAVLFPDATEKMHLAFMGKPKNGKSMSACQWGAIIGKDKTVLYNFADQGINASTKKILQLSGLASLTDLTITSSSRLDELEKDIKEIQPDIVFIDMINDYIDNDGATPSDFKTRFIQGFPDISFNFVFEATKTGSFKGDQKWTHIVDQLITIEDYVMSSRGRYGSGKRITWNDEVRKLNPALYEEVSEALQTFKENNGLSSSSDPSPAAKPETFLVID